MITIKEMINPKFGTGVRVYSSCGYAFVNQQNTEKSIDGKEKFDESRMHGRTDNQYERREGELDLTRFFKKDDFEDELVYANQVF